MTPNDPKKQTKPGASTSPYQQGVSNALAKAGEAHAMEAIQAGVPPQQIEAQAGLLDPQSQAILNQLLDFGSQGTVSTQDVLGKINSVAQTPVQTPGDGSLLGGRRGILPAIGDAFAGRGFNPMAPKTEPLGFDKAAQVVSMQNTMNSQALDVPKKAVDITKGIIDIRQTDPRYQDERLRASEKIKSEAQLAGERSRDMDKFFATVLQPKEMSAEINKQLGFLDTGLSALQELNRIVDLDPNILSNPNMPGNPTGQQIATLRGKIKNSLLRKDSGATITQQDERLLNEVLTPTGLKALALDNGTKKMQIKTLLKEVSAQRSRLVPGENTKAFVQNALKSGYSRDDVYNYLRERGEA